MTAQRATQRLMAARMKILASVETMFMEYGCRLIDNVAAMHGFDAEETKRQLIYKKGDKEKDTEYNIKMAEQVQSTFTIAAKNPVLLDVLSRSHWDPWEDTPFAGYVYLTAKQKGDLYGEPYFEVFAKEKGLTVEKRGTTTKSKISKASVAELKEMCTKEGLTQPSPATKANLKHTLMSYHGYDKSDADAKEKTTGYDRIVNGIRTEIKFALSHKDRENKCIKDNTFIINHVSEKKDWERLVFIGINPIIADSILIWFSKEDFTAHINTAECYFKRQQGGNDGGNDDWMISSTALMKFIELPFVKKGLDDW